MALSDNAIGFFLEAEDVSLSKTLKSAATNYEKYTKALEGYNQRAFESAQRGMGSVQQLVKSVRDLPGAVEKSMKKASGTIQKGLRPITQKVDLAISVGSAAKLKKLFGKAVSDAMAGANVRMTSTLPAKRMAMFEQGMGLRAQYRDVVQPPDMKGKIKPLKKFAKGGVVEGPAGIDKILALLTKDELVLPADVSKDLQKAAGGQLKGSGGKFASSKELSKMVAEVTNLADALDKMKGGLEAGVGTEQDMEAYQKGVEVLTAKVDGLQDGMSDLSFVTKARLSPVIMQATKRLEEFKEEGKETGTRMEILLGKILGPARFLAISKGVQVLQDGFNSLTSAGNAFGSGDELMGSIDNLNEMNKELGLSRKELRVVKVDAGKAALAIEGLSTPELSAAMLEGAQKGIRLSDGLVEIATSAGLAKNGMNLAAGEVADFGFSLRSDLDIGQQGFDSILASIGELSNDTNNFNVGAADLFAQTQKNVATLHNTLAALPADQAQAMVTNFNRLGASLETNFIAADGLRDVLARAIESGGSDMEAMGTATLLTGKNYQELRDTMVRGDIESLLEGVGDRLGSIDPQQLALTAKQLNISSKELGNLTKNGDALHDTMLRSANVVVANSEAQRVLVERSKATKSWFDLTKESVTDNISAFDRFGISGMEVIDFMKEFNLTALVAIGMLGKPLLGALTTAGAKLLQFGAFSAATNVSLAGTVGGLKGMAVKGAGAAKGLLAAIGPIGLVAAAVGALTVAAVGWYASGVEKELAATEAEQMRIHLDPNRVIGNIAQVQKQIDIDKAAGNEVNPSALRLLERYNAELDVMQGRTAAIDVQPEAVDIAQQLDAAPMSAEAIMALTASVPSMTSGAMEEKLDRSNELAEQMLAAIREQARGRGIAPPSVAGSAGPASSGLGNAVAGGDL